MPARALKLELRATWAEEPPRAAGLPPSGEVPHSRLSSPACERVRLAGKLRRRVLEGYYISSALRAPSRSFRRSHQTHLDGYRTGACQRPVMVNGDGEAKYRSFLVPGTRKSTVILVAMVMASAETWPPRLALSLAADSEHKS